MVDVNARVVQVMQDKGWTMYRLAKESGISYATLFNSLKRKSSFTVPILTVVCSALNISMSDLLNEEGDTVVAPKKTVKKFMGLAPQDQKIVAGLVDSLYNKQ